MECHEIFNQDFKEKDPRIKIAVIDTGIEATHVAFQEVHGRSLIKAAKIFCRGNHLTDAVGHGTHIANTLLQVAPQIELVIAQVDTGDPDVTDQVAEVNMVIIYRALTDNF